jgi:hypothetical protein
VWERVIAPTAGPTPWERRTSSDPELSKKSIDIPKAAARWWFGAADYGGALFGEVIAIAKRIKSGDYDSWYDANNAFADRLADEADGQLKKGHKISARDYYLRACSYYRSAEFFLHANPDDPRVKRAADRALKALQALEAIGYKPTVPVKLTDFADPAIREGWIRDKGMMVFQMYSDQTRMSIGLDRSFDFYET